MAAPDQRLTDPQAVTRLIGADGRLTTEGLIAFSELYAYVRALEGPVSVAADAGAARTITAADNGAMLRFSGAATVTLPVDAVSGGGRIAVTVQRAGAGAVAFAAGAGAAVQSKGGALTLAAQYSAATAVRVSADTWTVIGDVA